MRIPALRRYGDPLLQLRGRGHSRRTVLRRLRYLSRGCVPGERHDEAMDVLDRAREVAEQIGAGLLVHQIDDLASPGHEAAGT